MKKNLLLIALAAILPSISAQTNLLKNGDFETKGDWQVSVLDSKAEMSLEFGSTTPAPTGGAGKVLEASVAADSMSQVFIYQPVVLKKKTTYKYSLAFKDNSTNLFNHWIEVAWIDTIPVDGKDIAEQKIGGGVSGWTDCKCIEYDGLYESSCAATPAGGSEPSAYFQIPDSLDGVTIYFGINVGFWTDASQGVVDMDILFDNFSLVDSAAGPSSVKSLATEMPLNNFPNPFSLTTTVAFTTKINGKVELDVLNLQGGKVASLVNGYKPAGSYVTKFDGSMLSGGVYFYCLKVNGLTTIRKMTLIK